mgnify:CR=1 FL=1
MNSSECKSYLSLLIYDPKEIMKLEADYVVITSKIYYAEIQQQLIDLGKKLSSYNTKFFTCHCTGTSQFEILKPIMKEKLEYIGTGDSIEI